MGVGCYGAVASWRAPFAKRWGRISILRRTGESWARLARPYCTNVNLNAGSFDSSAADLRWPSVRGREVDFTASAIVGDHLAWRHVAANNFGLTTTIGQQG
jgi:hypothetical protein